MSQKEFFKKSEGDNWFERNKDRIEASLFDVKLIKDTLKFKKNDINNILEVGTSSGFKINELCTFFDSKGVGIDLSKKAIDEAKRKYPHIDFYHVGADQIQGLKSQFDLIYLGFMMYVLDRNQLFNVISQVDIALRPGGYLAILDFDSNHKFKVKYRDSKDFYSYRNDYSQILISSSHYHLAFKQSFSHGNNYFSEDMMDRISITILYKEKESYLNLDFI